VRLCWDHVVTHRTDISWAAIFAWLIDVMRAGSYTRSAVRYILNRAAGNSIPQIQARIVSMERYRESLASDKGHYLGTMRYVLGCILFLTMAMFFVLVSRVPPMNRVFVPPGFFDSLALMLLSLTIGGAILGIQFSALDTKEKVKQKLANIDAEIDKLKARLP
jgi:hypothetical protein